MTTSDIATKRSSSDKEIVIRSSTIPSGRLRSISDEAWGRDNDHILQYSSLESSIGAG